MTEISYPQDGIVTGDATTAPYSAEEWARLQKQMVGIGAQRNDTSIVLNSGSESAQLEGLAVTQNSPAGTSVLVNVGSALVNGTVYNTDTSVTLSIAANASGNARIDTIVLRKSVAAQTVRAAVLQGTPAASPVPPTLTQTPGVTWEVPLADIAVANGFSSITNTNVTPRAIGTTLADGVYANRVLNNSGAIRQHGDALIIDTSADRAATTSILSNHNLPLGFAVGRSPIAAVNMNVLNRGIGYVRTSSAVARGNYGYFGTTAGALDASVQRLANTVCVFLETTSGAGLALAYVDAGLRSTYGQLIGNLTLSGTSTNVDNLPQFYSEYEIEIIAASAIAATSEAMNIQFGSAGGVGQRDSTAANYYSYLLFGSNSVAAVASLQNLGATAAWQITIPGSTATNPAFYLSIKVKGVNGSANLKVATGTGFFKNSNANGGISVLTFGGFWSNVTKALEQIQITTAGGNNLTGQVNIYGRNGLTI